MVARALLGYSSFPLRHQSSVLGSLYFCNNFQSFTSYFCSFTIAETVKNTVNVCESVTFSFSKLARVPQWLCFAPAVFQISELVLFSSCVMLSVNTAVRWLLGNVPGQNT